MAQKGASVEHSPHYHTAAGISRVQVLFTDLGLGLGQSYSKTRECGLYSAVFPKNVWNGYKIKF